MNSTADVVIVGGGPAGAATAIWGAASGLRVTLLERCLFPRHRPGETLHPGLESILKQLGVEDKVSAASELRHEAVSVAWAGRNSIVPFGEDQRGVWKGYQVSREAFDTILIERARELGVEIVQPTSAGVAMIENGRVVGARSGESEIRAKFVIDAAGSAGWLRRCLDFNVEFASPPLRAYYGYCEGNLESLTPGPSLVGNETGWIWMAQIAPHRLHWTRLVFEGQHVEQPPQCFASFRQLGNIRGADVTWRHVPSSAGPGYFLVGDAASVLDPAASHGVLRALMSGMMASHAVKRILFDRIDEAEVYSGYRDWISDWFQSDVRHLTDFYRQLDRRMQFQNRTPGRKSLREEV